VQNTFLCVVKAKSAGCTHIAFTSKITLARIENLEQGEQLVTFKPCFCVKFHTQNFTLIRLVWCTYRICYL